MYNLFEAVDSGDVLAHPRFTSVLWHSSSAQINLIF